MTIYALRASAPTLGDLTAAIESFTAGIRLAVADQAGNAYQIAGITYDAPRLALILRIDTTKPVPMPQGGVFP